MTDSDTNIYTKHNVDKNEYQLAHIARKILGINTPEIVSYNKETGIMTSERVDRCCISDYYGEKNNDTPPKIYDKIREIIHKLLKAGIVYPDITGYNFIQDRNDVVWIVDFGHAYIKEPGQPDDSFVLKFLNGYNGWNPVFK